LNIKTQKKTSVKRAAPAQMVGTHNVVIKTEQGELDNPAKRRK